MSAISSSSSFVGSAPRQRLRESPFQGVSANIFRLMQEKSIRCYECFRPFAFQEDVRVHRATVQPSQTPYADPQNSEGVADAVLWSIGSMHPRHQVCLAGRKIETGNTRILPLHLQNCGECISALIPPLPPPQLQNDVLDVPMDNPPPQALPVAPAYLPPPSSFKGTVVSFILGVNADFVCALVHIAASRLFAVGCASLGLPIPLLFGLNVVFQFIAGRVGGFLSFVLFVKIQENMGLAAAYDPPADPGNILGARVGIFWSLGATAVVNPLRALRIALISLIALNVFMAGSRR